MDPPVTAYDDGAYEVGRAIAGSALSFPVAVSRASSVPGPVDFRVPSCLCREFSAAWGTIPFEEGPRCRSCRENQVPRPRHPSWANCCGRVHLKAQCRGHHLVRCRGHRLVRCRGHRPGRCRGHRLVRCRGHRLVRCRDHRRDPCRVRRPVRHKGHRLGPYTLHRPVRCRDRRPVRCRDRRLGPYTSL